MTDEPTTPGEHLDDEILVALVDGEATDEERGRAEQHLSGCSSCRERRDLLAGTVAVASVPVAPLTADLVSQQVGRALAEARRTPADELAPIDAPEQPHLAGRPAGAPVSSARRLRGRQRNWLRAPANVAAAVAVVIVIGFGAFVAELEIHAGGGSIPSSTGTNPQTTITTPAPPAAHVLQLREVVTPSVASCGTPSDPDPGTGVSIADVVDLKPHGTCVLLGPALAVVSGPVRAVESGPAGLSAPDTVTLYLPATRFEALAHLRLAAGTEVLAVFDGAAAGRLSSASVPAGSTTITVVIADLDPSVASYIVSSLSPA
jgi:hypothetical protein